MKNRPAGLRSESGQGIIEYVLLLVVVVTLAILLAAKFFKPLRLYMQNRIGDYVECLLDQGELPSLGGSEASVEDCDAQKYFVSGATKSGKTGEGSTTNDQEQNTKADQAKKSQQSDASSGRDRAADSVGQSTGANGRSRGFKIGATDGAGGEGGAIPAEAENKANKEKGSSSGRVARFGMGFRASQGRVVTVYGISGLLESERDRIKKREQKVQKIAAVDEGQATEAGRVKKFGVEAKAKKTRMGDLDLEPWSFGRLLRILLILVIAIALFLFVAGQLVQISKGMEK